MFFLSQLLLVLSAYICFLPSALRYNFSYLPRIHVYAALLSQYYSFSVCLLVAFYIANRYEHIYCM